MKHTNIASTLGLEEAEDLTEGYFLQPEEASVVDAALGTVATTEAARAKLAGQVEALTSQLAERDDTIKANASTLANQTATISQLNTRIAKLAKEPSGKGTHVTSKEDVTETNAQVPSWMDESNPINQWVDKRTTKKVTVQ